MSNKTVGIENGKEETICKFRQYVLMLLHECPCEYR